MIWEFRGKTHFKWLQKSSGDHTEVWLSKASAEEAEKSQTVHSKLHAACISLQENQICSSMTRDSEGTPAVGFKLVTFNIHGGTALSLKVNPTSWWSTEQVHWLSFSLSFVVIQLPHLVGWRKGYLLIETGPYKQYGENCHVRSAIKGSMDSLPTFTKGM